MEARLREVEARLKKVEARLREAQPEDNSLGVKTNQDSHNTLGRARPCGGKCEGMGQTLTADQVVIEGDRSDFYVGESFSVTVKADVVSKLSIRRLIFLELEQNSREERDIPMDGNVKAITLPIPGRYVMKHGNQKLGRVRIVPRERITIALSCMFEMPECARDLGEGLKKELRGRYIDVEIVENASGVDLFLFFVILENLVLFSYKNRLWELKDSSRTKSVILVQLIEKGRIQKFLESGKGEKISSVEKNYPSGVLLDELEFREYNNLYIAIDGESADLESCRDQMYDLTCLVGKVSTFKKRIKLE